MQTTERVTVTIPIEMRQAAQREAEERNVALSTVVSEALAEHVRARALREVVEDYEAEFGVITEDEMREYAARVGIPYSSPRRRVDAA